MHTGEGISHSWEPDTQNVERHDLPRQQEFVFMGAYESLEAASIVKCSADAICRLHCWHVHYNSQGIGIGFPFLSLFLSGGLTVLATSQQAINA